MILLPDDMYDVIPSGIGSIPSGAKYVAGYDDGAYAWSSTNWNRFPSALHCHVAVFSSTNSGHAADCETGDMTPASSVSWVRMRRGSGLLEPIVYCSMSTWPSVIQAFLSAGVTMPLFWIAKYDGVRNLPTISYGGITYQVVAKQYQSTNIDYSCITDIFVSAVGGDVSALDNTDPNWLQLVARVAELSTGAPTAGSASASAPNKDEANWLLGQLNALSGKVDAVSASLYGDIANLIKSQAAGTTAAVEADVDPKLAAAQTALTGLATSVAALQTGGVDVNALAASVVSALVPQLPAEVSAADLATAVAHAFATRLGA